jgi:epoxyqueuosine reductase
MADWSAIKQRISILAREAGFDLCGVAPAAGLAELEYFPRWIAEGRHGEMEYLASRTADQQLKRASLAHVAPWARAVIVCVINYNSPQPYSTECTDRSRGWIARYAWSERDYHDTVLERLRRLEGHLPSLAIEFADKQTQVFPGNAGPDSAEPLRTWCYVDTGPVVERVFAHCAGVGWLGKNTCIINQQLGSWLFLGVLLTSLPLPPDLPAPDRCGSCTRCLDACPTAALTAPYQMDASRCISYLTIEKRGDIPVELREGIGRNIFGCDICQDVCPWNRKAPTSSIFAPLPNSAVPDFSLVNPGLRRLVRMSAEEFRAVFRHSPVKRAKYQGFMRNVIIAIGNSGDPSLASELEIFAHGTDPLLRRYARWALKRLRRS